MKHTAKSFLHAIALCLLAFPMTACPPTGGEGEGEGEGDADTFILPGGVALEMVSIPAGAFMMGSTNGLSDEEPAHEVTLTQDFQIGQFEVTKAQWQALMGTTPWSGASNVLNDRNSPAVYISWDNAKSFIMALNNHTGETFRLPTEAEWEYACRAGSTTEYSFDEPATNLGDHAWHYYNACDVSECYAHTVGQKLPNTWGLYDMHGNVWEWCQDWYGSYPSSPATDPTGPTSGLYRVLRGGSFNALDYAGRSAYRNFLIFPVYSYTDSGFRVARSITTHRGIIE